MWIAFTFIINKIDKFLRDIEILGSIYKLISLILGFLAPLKILFHLMFFFLIVNFISGVYKNCFINKEKLNPKKIRYTIEKTGIYILIITMIWLFELHIIGTDSLYISRTIVGLMLLAEFKSATENFDSIIHTEFFTTVYKQLLKIFKTRINNDNK